MASRSKTRARQVDASLGTKLMGLRWRIAHPHSPLWGRGKHCHCDRSRSEQLGAALQLVQNVFDRRLHHQVARGRVDEDRDRVAYGVAEAVTELPNPIAVRRELGSQRRHLARERSTARAAVA